MRASLLLVAGLLLGACALPVCPAGCPTGWVCVGRPQGGAVCADAAVRCGGLGGSPCDGGATCVDDPRDGCDPARGGADCSGLCAPP